MRQFVKWTEKNDWEGETWHFWCQWDGNQEELRKLKGILDQLDDEDDYDFPYELNLDNVRYEDEVDLLVEEADWGYMKSHNKVVGIFTCPADLNNLEDVSDTFYKGRIEDYFV